MSKKKAIIFDMDGLMIDTEGLYFEVERVLARSYGREVRDETLWKMMGRKSLESMTIFAEDLELTVSPQELLRARDEMFQQKLEKTVLPMKGLSEILDTFHGKLKLAIATGSPNKFLDIAMRKLDIRNYFNVLQTSDEIVNGKPDPEIYLTAISKLGLVPEECIVLEDSSNGALAAKRAGCYTIAVPSEYTCRQDFSFADYRAADLDDASRHITSLLL